MSNIQRPHFLRRVERLFAVHRCVGILGPRQCGKTTLASMVAETEGKVTIFDLESPIDRRRLSSPLRTLQRLDGLIILDEIQRMPELFEILRVVIDQKSTNQRFLILGSADPGLMRGVSETLAGRVGFVDLSGFTLDEVSPDPLERLWERGGFPLSYLAPGREASADWRQSFIRTFLERDIPNLGISIPAETLRRFWTMVAHYHGQIWNAAEFARSLGSSEPTARRYLDILAGAFMVRVLPPWHENIGKRQIKSPKIYLRDSGLLHSILGLVDSDVLRGHPKFGASWEGFAIEQILQGTGIRDGYFWGTHAGAELDLLLFHKGKRFGFEFKTGDAPSSTRSMRTAIETLGLTKLIIVYPGEVSFEIDEWIDVRPLAGVREMFQ